jgi:hypothetical protein
VPVAAEVKQVPGDGAVAERGNDGEKFGPYLDVTGGRVMAA